MKRLIASGAAVVAVGAFPVSAAEAVGDQPPQCAPVYDEYAPGATIPSALQDVINEYAKNKVSVHVELLKDGASQGNNTKDDVTQYQYKLAAECGYTDTNYISVYVSRNPNLYHVQAVNKADADMPKAYIESHYPQFQENLVDASTPFADDVAAFLTDLDPYAAKDVPAAANPSNGESQNSNSSFPTGILLEIVGGVAILGAAGARTKRGISVSNRFSNSKKASAELSLSIKNAIADAEDALRYLPEDDALELRAAETDIMNSVSALDDDTFKAMKAYKSERKRLWPSFHNVDAAADDLDEVTTKGKDLLVGAQQQLKDLKRHSENATTIAANFKAAVDTLVTNHDQLKAQGWDLGNLDAKLLAITKLRTQVDDLVGKGYVDKPGDLIEGSSADMQDLGETLTGLPGRREVADKTVAGFADRITLSQTVVADTHIRMSALHNTYDSSCSEDLDKIDEQVDALVSKMQSTNADSLLTTGVQNVATLEATETAISDFATFEAKIQQLQKQAANRQTQLAKIQAELPTRITNISGELGDVHGFAFERFPEDVEDETRRKISTADDALMRIVTTDVKADKPMYLAIDSSLQQISVATNQLGQQAQAEKQEMDELRSNALTLSSEAEQDLDDLQSYVTMHRSDISGVSTAFSIPTPQTRLSRAQLRGQVSDYNDLISSIETQLQNAQNDVARAEAARAAALAAIEAQREAERAEERRQESMRNSGGGFGGVSNTGGGFGGSNNSGGAF